MTEWICIQERYQNSFFPVYLILEIMTKEMARISGEPVHKFVNVHHASHTQYFIQNEPWQKLQKSSLEKIQENPLLMKQLLQELREKTPEFLSFCRTIHQTNWKQKTNAEAWTAYEQYCDYYKTLGLLGEPFAISVKDALTTQLENYFKQQLEKKGLNKKFAEYFSTMVSPTVPSFATREEQELVQIAANAQLKGKKTVEKELEKHTQNYFWLPYDYEGTIWEKTYFETVIEELMAKSGNLKEQAEKLQKRFAELEKKQNQIIQASEMDEKHRQLFKALQDCSEAMDYKKELFTQSHWYKNNLMKNIATRLEIPFYHTYFIQREEMKPALMEGKLDRQTIEQRTQYCVSIVQNGSSRIELGENAKAWEQKIQAEQTEKTDSKEIHGQCASPGSAIGKARVLESPKQIGEMQEGEILVAQATTPDFVPAMKKAKAIITNEGGLTSHAAIVSRELGVPCIVGTQNATKRIKTGDLIDVHAASGIVKKIQK